MILDAGWSRSHYSTSAFDVTYMSGHFKTKQTDAAICTVFPANMSFSCIFYSILCILIDYKRKALAHPAQL
jgi:hypothetical protein